MAMAWQGRRVSNQTSTGRVCVPTYGIGWGSKTAASTWHVSLHLEAGMPWATALYTQGGVYDCKKEQTSGRCARDT